MDIFLIWLDIILGLIAIKYVYDIHSYLKKINSTPELKNKLLKKFK